MEKSNLILKFTSSLLSSRKGRKKNAYVGHGGGSSSFLLFFLAGGFLSLQLFFVTGVVVVMPVVSGAPNFQSKTLNSSDFLLWGSSSPDTPLRCICDGECEPIREEDCRWGLTLDVCGCCLLCSRGEGEPCGGAVGTCAPPLHCLLDQESPKKSNEPPSTPQEGICSKLGDGQICSSPVQRFGCLFHGENCVCENHWVCPDIDLFLFDTEESCRSRIAILISQQQQHHHPSSLSHADDGQLATQSRATGSCTPREDESNEEKCGKVEECPSDSYRIPSSLHHQNEDCCPIVHPCQCNPGLLCSKPSNQHHRHQSCPPGFRWVREKVDPFLTKEGGQSLTSTLGQPGHCCPRWKCKRVKSRRRRRRHNLFRSQGTQQQSSKQYKFYDAKEDAPSP